MLSLSAACKILYGIFYVLVKHYFYRLNTEITHLDTQPVASKHLKQLWLPWHLAGWHMVALSAQLAIEFFKKWRWWTAATLKIEKSLCLGNSMTDQGEI